MTTKLCKDCKFYDPEIQWWLLLLPILGWVFLFLWWYSNSHHTFSKCKRPNCRNVYTSVERTYYKYLDVCGPSGQYWEDRHGQ